MFISRKAHLKEIEELVVHYDQLLSLQQELQERRIHSLESHIDDLKKLIFVPQREPSREMLEIDSVMSVSEKPVEMSEEERSKILAGERELDMMLSGNYDTDLLN